MSTQAFSRAPRRMRMAFLILMAMGVVLAARLFYWQIIRWDELSKRADQQNSFITIVPAQRGDIWSSDGTLLAKDVFRYTITVAPKDVRNPDKFATDLAPLLKMSRDSVLAKLKSNPDKNSVILLADAPVEIGEAVREYKTSRKLLYLTVDAKPARLYPNGALAAQVIGFVNAEKERKVAYGIEQFKDAELRGTNGKVLGLSDVLNEPIPFELPQNIPPMHGATIVLTLDSGMQRIVEQELQNAIRQSRAESGSIIVMDPKTGAILALAVWPTADLNKYFEPANKGRFANQAISDQYEPGSVFKIVTVAAALDAGVIRPTSCFQDDGSIYIGGRVIKNHNEIAPGRVCLTDVLRMSLNVEMVKIGISLGAERFYQSVRQFGFGELTRIELANEVPGSVKRVGDGVWREIDLGTNAFGQGIAVTPVQMIAAVAAVANQGKLMKPYIIQSIQPANAAKPVVTAPQMVRQVIQPATAQTLTKILSDSIIAESTNKAIVPGYSIAGKTGTAQIPIAGILDPKWTIASFVGYLPADDPRFVILVKLDKPQSSEWGSQVASPVFAAVAKQIVMQAGLPPDKVRLAAK